MRIRISKLLLIFAIVLSTALVAALAADPLLRFRGACDGSAAVAIDKNLFLSATDEDNLLRVYDINKPGGPLNTFNLEEQFSISPKGEMDIEGATLVGDTVFFVSSHKRGRKEKSAPGYLMAMKVTSLPKQTPKLSTVGRPYLQLSESLLANIPELANKPMNIEGLTVWKNAQLLLGFRRPSVENDALLVPLLNPLQVVEASENPRFGPSIKLDLSGLVIRAIEYWPERSIYVIVAGSEKAHGQFQIYTWTGEPTDGAKPGPVLDLDGESIIVFRGENKRVLVVSDDSGDRGDEISSKCRNLPAGDLARTFRARWIAL